MRRRPQRDLLPTLGVWAIRMCEVLTFGEGATVLVTKSCLSLVTRVFNVTVLVMFSFVSFPLDRYDVLVIAMLNPTHKVIKAFFLCVTLLYDCLA
jgi:hypothetical protein